MPVGNVFFMQKFLLLAMGFVLASCDGAGIGLTTPPNNQQADAAVTKFVKTDHNCKDQYLIKSLTVMTLGDYESSSEAWPASVKLLTTCKDKTGYEYVVYNMVEGNLYEVYIRNTGEGKYEAFLPDSVQKARKKARKMMKLK